MKKAGINLQVLAEKGLKIFYTQVFRDNFFHADMHPGNIFINPQNPQDPQIILLDFGICGSLPKGLRVDLANNFMAFFKQDYRRIAELHIESGWVPADTNLEDLESATRTICEPYFSRPIEEISFGEVMLKTFQMAKRFQLIIQPEFILLQKTLLNIEGLGRQLYPQLDIWKVSEPVLRDIMKQHYGSSNAMEKIKQSLPKWLDQSADIPAMLHQLLALKTRPLPRHLKIQQQKIEAKQARQDNKTRQAMIATGLSIATAVLYALDNQTGIIQNLPNSALLTGLVAMLLIWKSLKK
ncbi:MAG: AarF/UbiB family protein [Proteobacteria bacterium]|nr:AarF/UbiB family protein [Pseudomonadota bacterium]